METDINKAKYAIGEIIHHRLFNYRGVIVDVDYKFQASPQWYQQVAKSRPPKNKPWFHVLVDQSEMSTYVAEQNLQHSRDHEAIGHPLLKQFFSGLENGRYIQQHKNN